MYSQLINMSFSNSSFSSTTNTAIPTSHPIVGGLGSSSMFRSTFLSHVFSTTDYGKNELLNIVQYSFLGIIPVMCLNYGIQKLIPEPDGEATSLVILAEIIAQILFMFIGLLLIHRIIDYIPTYSGLQYHPLHLTSVILSIFMIVLSLQTKIGIKCNLLVERLSDAWYGAAPRKRNNAKFTPIPLPHAVTHQTGAPAMAMPAPPLGEAGFNPKRANLGMGGIGSAYN